MYLIDAIAVAWLIIVGLFGIVFGGLLSAGGSVSLLESYFRFFLAALPSILWLSYSMYVSRKKK